MKNLAYHFYKGYFKGFESISVERKAPLKGWKEYKDKNIIKQKEYAKALEEFFKKKNAPFLAAEIKDFPSITSPLKSGIQLETLYPGLLFGTGYTKGIGAVGEFKIGFQLDHTTGLPIIPGSSVKGTMRAVFPNIVRKKEDNQYVYSFYVNPKDSDVETLKKGIINKVKIFWLLTILKALGNDDENTFLGTRYQPKEIEISQADYQLIFNIAKEIFDGKIMASKPEDKDVFLSIYKRDIFHDAFPVSSHDDKLFETDSITPHNQKSDLSYEENMLRNPIPLLFMKIKPQVSYSFNFDTKKGSYLSSGQKQLLFHKILLSYGIGAKTNVGYGQFHNSYYKEEKGSQNTATSQGKIGNPPPNTEIKPAYNTQKLNYKKRYDMDAIVIKSRKPNIVKVFVSKDYCPEIRLDRQPNPIEVGRIIIVDVSISKKGNVTQANYKSDKK